MKVLFAIVLFLSNTQSLVKDLRKQYALIGVSERYVNEVLSLSANNSDPTIRAYAAGAEMASAQFKSSPFSKLSAFKSGKAKLEKLVSDNSQNPEIRFIRYSVQLKCPAMLGYTGERKTDRTFLLKEMPLLKTEDPDLYKYLLSFLLLHDSLSASEKSSLGLK